jgi:hypothetical protein
MREVGIDRTLSTIHGKTRFFDARVPTGSYLLDHRVPWFRPEGVGGNLGLAGFLLHRLLRHPMDTFALEDRPGPDGVRALDVAGDRLRLECLVRPVVRAGVLAEPEAADVSLLHLVRLLRIIVLTDYLSLSGGMAAFHEALAARLPVRLETPVERLVVDGGRVAGVSLAGSGEVLRADHVVVATTAPRAAAMCPGDWRVEREVLGSVRIPPAVIVSFFLDRPLEKDVWSYMFPAAKGRIVSFCTDAARKNPAMVPSGKSILQAWPVHPASEEIAPLSDVTWPTDAARAGGFIRRLLHRGGPRDAPPRRRSLDPGGAFGPRPRVPPERRRPVRRLLLRRLPLGRLPGTRALERGESRLADRVGGTGAPETGLRARKPAARSGIQGPGPRLSAAQHIPEAPCTGPSPPSTVTCPPRSRSA